MIVGEAQDEPEHVGEEDENEGHDCESGQSEAELGYVQGIV